MIRIKNTLLKFKIFKFINLFLLKHKTLAEFIRFCFVGGLATIADMLVMGIVLYLYNPSAYLSFTEVFIGGTYSPKTSATVIGTGAGFIAGLIINYFLSIFFVYENKGISQTKKGFMIFAVLSAFGLGIHLLGMYLGYSVLHIDEWIVKIFLTVLVMFYNFASKKIILFRKAEDIELTEFILEPDTQSKKIA